MNSFAVCWLFLFNILSLTFPKNLLDYQENLQYNTAIKPKVVYSTTTQVNSRIKHKQLHPLFAIGPSRYFFPGVSDHLTRFGTFVYTGGTMLSTIHKIPLVLQFPHDGSELSPASQNGPRAWDRHHWYSSAEAVWAWQTERCHWSFYKITNSIATAGFLEG